MTIIASCRKQPILLNVSSLLLVFIAVVIMGLPRLPQVNLNSNVALNREVDGCEGLCSSVQWE